MSGHKGFENELSQLRRLDGRVHRHIITLLASFEYDGQCHFIFPWAECTLEDYWDRFKPYDEKKKPPQSQLDLDYATWVAKQLEGITGAIKAIHEPLQDHLDPNEKRFGRHSDLKPDNILWFQSDKDPRGILVVTDLGLATFNREVSRSIQPGSSARVPGYRAPECDIQGGVARRETDIWTLGCIYLELITWLLGGPVLLQELGDLRLSVDHLGGAKGKLFFEFEEQKRSEGEKLSIQQQNAESSPGRQGKIRVKRTVAQVSASTKQHGITTRVLEV